MANRDICYEDSIRETAFPNCRDARLMCRVVDKVGLDDEVKAAQEQAGYSEGEREIEPYQLIGTKTYIGGRGIC